MRKIPAEEPVCGVMRHLEFVLRVYIENVLIARHLADFSLSPSDPYAAATSENGPRAGALAGAAALIRGRETRMKVIGNWHKSGRSGNGGNCVEVANVWQFGVERVVV